MTIDNFYTSQVSHSVSSKGNSNGAGKSSANLQSQGLDFFGSLLQNALESLSTDKTKVSGSAKSDKESLMNALAVNEDVAEELSAIENPTLADIIALNQKALEQEIRSSDNTINAELNKDGKAPSVEEALMLDNNAPNKPALNNLHKLLQRLEKLMQAESPALSAMNITPEQVTDLKAQVENLMKKIEGGDIALENTEDNAENFGGLLGMLVKLMPAQSKQDISVTGKSLHPSNDLAARLNSLSIGAGDEGFPQPPSYGDLDDFEQILQQISKGKDGKGADIEQILKNAGAGKSNGAEGMENAAKNAQTSTLQGWPFSMNGSLFAPMSYSESAYDKLGLPTATSQSGNALSPLTSLVTQSHSASQPHPGTQIVAASIKKMAGTGEAKNIRIQLDPPELGRVEIKMTFNKDKTVKAVLTAEKPETFMMMQRDAQVLERALQEAGIEADGSELSFELAQDNQNFGQDGSHDGSRNKTGGGSNGEAGDEEVIETTMTWHVDPDTGHMRYNILA